MSDLIDRQAAKEAMRQAWVKHMPMSFDPAMAFVLGELDDLPSAQPEPCEDAVSRQAVLAGAVTHYSVSGANIRYRNAVPVEYIQDLPSIEPVAKDINVPVNDTISRQAALDAIKNSEFGMEYEAVEKLPSAQPEIIRCKECKHNPKETWLECPMSHLNEKQRPETAWCWKGERRTDG